MALPKAIGVGPRGSARYPRLTTWVEESIEQTLTFFRLPRQHHKHLKSTDESQPVSVVFWFARLAVVVFFGTRCKRDQIC
jgi:Transposase, Mutator family